MPELDRRTELLCARTSHRPSPSPSPTRTPHHHLLPFLCTTLVAPTFSSWPCGGLQIHLRSTARRATPATCRCSPAIPTAAAGSRPSRGRVASHKAHAEADQRRRLGDATPHLHSRRTSRAGRIQPSTRMHTVPRRVRCWPRLQRHVEVMMEKRALCERGVRSCGCVVLVRSKVLTSLFTRINLDLSTINRESKILQKFSITHQGRRPIYPHM